MTRSTFINAMRKHWIIILWSAISAAFLAMYPPHVDIFKWVLLAAILATGGFFTARVSRSKKTGIYFILIGVLLQVCLWHLLGSHISVFGQEFDTLWLLPPLVAILHAFIFSKDIIGMRFFKGVLISYIAGLPFIFLKIANWLYSLC